MPPPSRTAKLLLLLTLLTTCLALDCPQPGGWRWFARSVGGSLWPCPYVKDPIEAVRKALQENVLEQQEAVQDVLEALTAWQLDRENGNPRPLLVREDTVGPTSHPQHATARPHLPSSFPPLPLPPWPLQLTLTGATGSGKTYLAETVAKAILQKKRGDSSPAGFKKYTSAHLVPAGEGPAALAAVQQQLTYSIAEELCGCYGTGVILIDEAQMAGGPGLNQQAEVLSFLKGMSDFNGHAQLVYREREEEGRGQSLPQQQGREQQGEGSSSSGQEARGAGDAGGAGAGGGFGQKLHSLASLALDALSAAAEGAGVASGSSSSSSSSSAPSSSVRTVARSLPVKDVIVFVVLDSGVAEILDYLGAAADAGAPASSSSSAVKGRSITGSSARAASSSSAAAAIKLNQQQQHQQQHGLDAETLLPSLRAALRSQLRHRLREAWGGSASSGGGSSYLETVSAAVIPLMPYNHAMLASIAGYSLRKLSGYNTFKTKFWDSLQWSPAVPAALASRYSVDYGLPQNSANGKLHATVAVAVAADGAVVDRQAAAGEEEAGPGSAAVATFDEQRAVLLLQELEEQLQGEMQEQGGRDAASSSSRQALLSLCDREDLVPMRRNAFSLDGAASVTLQKGAFLPLISLLLRSLSLQHKDLFKERALKELRTLGAKLEHQAVQSIKQGSGGGVAAGDGAEAGAAAAQAARVRQLSQAYGQALKKAEWKVQVQLQLQCPPDLLPPSSSTMQHSQKHHDLDSSRPTALQEGGEDDLAADQRRQALWQVITGTRAPWLQVRACLIPAAEAEAEAEASGPLTGRGSGKAPAEEKEEAAPEKESVVRVAASAFLAGAAAAGGAAAAAEGLSLRSLTRYCTVPYLGPLDPQAAYARS